MYPTQLDGNQVLGYVCVYVIKTTEVVIDRKSMVQKVVFELGNY